MLSTTTTKLHVTRNPSRIRRIVGSTTILRLLSSTPNLPYYVLGITGISANSMDDMSQHHTAAASSSNIATVLYKVIRSYNPNNNNAVPTKKTQEYYINNKPIRIVQLIPLQHDQNNTSSSSSRVWNAITSFVRTGSIRRPSPNNTESSTTTTTNLNTIDGVVASSYTFDPYMLYPIVATYDANASSSPETVFHTDLLHHINGIVHLETLPYYCSSTSNHNNNNTNTIVSKLFLFVTTAMNHWIHPWRMTSSPSHCVVTSTLAIAKALGYESTRRNVRNKRLRHAHQAHGVHHHQSATIDFLSSSSLQIYGYDYVGNDNDDDENCDDYRPPANEEETDTKNTHGYMANIARQCEAATEYAKQSRTVTTTSTNTVDEAAHNSSVTVAAHNDSTAAQRRQREQHYETTTTTTTNNPTTSSSSNVLATTTIKSWVRVVNLRFGTIVSAEPGTILYYFYKLYSRVNSYVYIRHIGGSDGNQSISFMTSRDAAHAVLHILRQPYSSRIAGPVNVCTPFPTTNKEYFKVLDDEFNTVLPSWMRSTAAVDDDDDDDYYSVRQQRNELIREQEYRTHHRYGIIVPDFIVRLVCGQMGTELILGGTKCVPYTLLETHFSFPDSRRLPTISTAIRSSIAIQRKHEFQLQYYKK